VSGLEQQLASYRSQVETFRWDVPEAFNFGRNVVDRYAADPTRPALLWRDSAGRERRLSFADVAAASNRFAHVLRSLGVAPGEPVIVMLPRIPEWQIVTVGALKAGVLVIPSSTILRPKDIAYRGQHSRAVAVVTSREAKDPKAAEPLRRAMTLDTAGETVTVSFPEGVPQPAETSVAPSGATTDRPTPARPRLLPRWECQPCLRKTPCTRSSLLRRVRKRRLLLRSRA